MPNYNKVMLMGNLTRDPEVRFTPKGTAVGQVSLAINRKWKTEQGESKEDVTFVECTAWGKTAEVMAQYLTKGKPVFVEGRLQLDQWDDKESGQRKTKLKVVIESFQFVGTPSGNGEPKPNERAGRPATLKADSEAAATPEDDSNIPF